MAGSTRAKLVNVKIPEDAALRARIETVLEFTSRRYLNTRDHAAWQIMHGLLAFQEKLLINYIDKSGEKDDKQVPALQWLMDGGELRGFNLIPRGEGRLDTLLEGGSKTGQGHDDQWLAVLSQCNKKWDDPLIYQGKTYKIGDLVEQAKLDLRQGNECSWTLIGLTAYPEHLSFDDKWEITRKEMKDGKEVDVTKEWSIERVVAMEARQELTTSACGGTHRLIGMQMALTRYKKHLREKKAPMVLKDGWLAAQNKIEFAVRIIKEFQQEDGAFSAKYLERPSMSNDISTRISTTGHTLEFLTFALDDAQLKEDWVVAAVVHLCELFEQTKTLPVECGSLYHAAHALQHYAQRRWGEE